MNSCYIYCTILRIFNHSAHVRESLYYIQGETINSCVDQINKIKQAYLNMPSLNPVGVHFLAYIHRFRLPFSCSDIRAYETQLSYPNGSIYKFDKFVRSALDYDSGLMDLFREVSCVNVSES